MSVIDETINFTVVNPLTPKASILAVLVTSSFGTFNITQGEQASARTNDEVSIDVNITNIGDVEGELFVRLSDETGVIDTVTKYVIVGGQDAAHFAIIMPSRNVSFTVEVGH